MSLRRYAREQVGQWDGRLGHGRAGLDVQRIELNREGNSGRRGSQRRDGRDELGDGDGRERRGWQRRSRQRRSRRGRVGGDDVDVEEDLKGAGRRRRKEGGVRVSVTVEKGA